MGRFKLGNIATVDKIKGDDFLKFKSLYVSNMSAGYNPLFVRIQDVSATDFYIRIIVNDDSTLNLRSVARQEASGQSESAESKQAPPKKEDVSQPEEKKEYFGDILTRNIEIGRISIQNGAIAFDDRHVKPSFSSTLTELTGRLTGVTSITTKPADVDIRGKIGRRIPIEITGKLHPFKPNLFVDLKASLRDFNLSPLTPYSGTYAG